MHVDARVCVLRLVHKKQEKRCLMGEIKLDDTRHAPLSYLASKALVIIFYLMQHSNLFVCVCVCVCVYVLNCT